MATDEHVETVIIGGGQAGLAVGYHLRSQKRAFVILDANERVGDSWRKRWPTLRLYSPASFDGLPGMAFPAPAHSYPTGLEMADYLESYAKRFELPVRSGIAADAGLVAASRGRGLFDCPDQKVDELHPGPVRARERAVNP